MARARKNKTDKEIACNDTAPAGDVPYDSPSLNWKELPAGRAKSELVGAISEASFRRFRHSKTGAELLLFWRFGYGWYWELHGADWVREEIPAGTSDPWDEEPNVTTEVFWQAEKAMMGWKPGKGLPG